MNVFPIQIPPLRERQEDIPILLDAFLQRFSKEFNKKMACFGRDALDLLARYHWPGNVRELRNIVERICIMYDVAEIQPGHLPQEIWGREPRAEIGLNLEIPPQGVVLDEIVAQVEKELIAKAIKITGGNIARTSRLLNLPRGTLRYKLEKYNLD